MKISHLLSLVVIWTCCIFVSFVWNYNLIIDSNESVVLNKAQASFEQIVMARAWNAAHGGLYAPTTAENTPNIFLKDSLRDIISEDGMHLTKINPAYMTRQIAVLNREKNDIQFHITSLKPIRPDNIADDWEKRALQSFEEGQEEVLELVRTDSSSTYRYMAPLTTIKNCLKCHAFQGYVEGDIRGGISVSFPANVFMSTIHTQFYSLGIAHILILIIGIAGLILFYKMNSSYYKKLSDKNLELRRINATKDKFFSIVAHDLRSPFQSILGYADLLQNEFEKLSEADRKNSINGINKSAASSFNLLENLLLWAKSQQDGIVLYKEKLNVRKLIDQAFEPYLSGAEIKSIQVNIELKEDAYVYGDAFCLKTVLANLFTNAIKFTPQQGLIQVKASENDTHIEIHLTDSGVGIPKETIPKLFLIEESHSTLGTEKEKGSGLGLLLCKEFIDKHNGSIRVESEAGKGTTMIIAIPQKADEKS